MGQYIFFDLCESPTIYRVELKDMDPPQCLPNFFFLFFAKDLTHFYLDFLFFFSAVTNNLNTMRSLIQCSLEIVVWQDCPCILFKAFIGNKYHTISMNDLFSKSTLFWRASVPEVALVLFSYRGQTPEKRGLVWQDSRSPFSGPTSEYRLVCKMKMECTVTTVFEESAV